MLQQIRSLCVLVCVSSLFLVSKAQFFDIGAASLSGAPVGLISRLGPFGDQESYASFGHAPVGVYHREQYAPLPLYRVPVIPPVPVYRPVKPPMRPPPKRVITYPARPVVRPPVKLPCQATGSCRPKPVRPVVRPPMKPGVRPPRRPVRPYGKPSPKIPRSPQTYGPQPGGVSGRGGMLGGLLSGLGGGLGGGGLGDIFGR